MRIITLIFWSVCIAAAAGFVPAPAAFFLKIIALMLLLAHAIEFFVFRKIIEAKGDSGLKSFLMTMVYGVFYFKY